MAGKTGHGSKAHRDDALALALACGLPVAEAAVLAGVGERTAFRRLAEPGFRERVAGLRGGLVVATLGRPADPPPALARRDDAEELGTEVGAAFGRVADRERLLALLPEQVTWFDLDSLGRLNPEAALRRWEEVQGAARREVRSGHRAARALEGAESNCQVRARFLAVRAELFDAWQPRNAAEGPDGPEYADFHALQHTYLTLLGRHGVDLRTAQELAGHSSPELTARYSHRRLYDLTGAVEKLPNLIPSAPGSEANELRATGPRPRRVQCRMQ